MLKQLKSADRGVGTGAMPGHQGPTDADLGLPDDSALNSQLDALRRQSKRGDAAAAADAKLAELKKKMGQ
jgi:hypothetical protein